MPCCWNASAHNHACTDGAEPCHQWPCSLFRTGCIFQVPYSYCSSGPSLLCGITICQQTSLKGKSWANHLKRKKKKSQRKLYHFDVPKRALCCCSMIISPALQWLAISSCLVITDRCSSATEPQFWITWSYPAIQNGIFLNAIFVRNWD